jgi:predicted HicB family RNase H-like nuclease
MGAKYTEAQKRATIKYLKNNFDELHGIRVPKGMKSKIKEHAEKQGKSLCEYVVGLIEKDMKEAGE